MFSVITFIIVIGCHSCTISGSGSRPEVWEPLPYTIILITLVWASFLSSTQQWNSVHYVIKISFQVLVCASGGHWYHKLVLRTDVYRWGVTSIWTCLRTLYACQPPASTVLQLQYKLLSGSAAILNCIVWGGKWSTQYGALNTTRQFKVSYVFFVEGRWSCR